MKKILLSAAAVAVTAFAANAYEHSNPKITEVYPKAAEAEGELAPDNFKSATATSIPKLFKHPTKQTGVYNTDLYIVRDNFIKGNEAYEKGVIIVGGPHGCRVEEAAEQVAGGFQLVDFGGECGNVFVLNGKGSKLGEELAKLGINATLGELPQIQEGLQFYWVPNPSVLKSFAKGNEANNIRLSVEVMIYHPQPTADLTASGKFYINDDANNVHPTGSNGAAGSSLQMKDFVYTWADKAVEGSEFFEDDCKDTGIWHDEEAGEDDSAIPHWNPYRWQVNEVDFGLAPDDVDGAWGYSPRLKMELQGNFLNTGGAIIFRNVKFSEVKDNPIEAPAHRVTWNWYTLGAGAGVENVATENSNAPVEYFNLQGVRVNNPENGIFICRQGSKVTKVVK